MKPSYALLASAMICMLARPAIAGEEADYNQRPAERDLATFRALDRNGVGRLTRDDVHGNIDMEARFDDIDINRDGIVLAAELERYIRLRYGVSMNVAVESKSMAPSSNVGRTVARP